MMQSSARSLCIFCQHGLLTSNLSRSLAPRQHVRSFAQMQRRKPPSRMVLSRKVAEPRVKPAGRVRPKSSREAGPFRAVNTTRAPRNAIPPKAAQTFERASERRPSRTTEGRERKSSDETFHALKMQKQLSTVPYSQRNNIKETIAEIDSFSKLELTPIVEQAIVPQALAGQGGTTPTPIQRVAIPALKGQVLGRRPRQASFKAGQGTQQFLIAAETGSGKTLAYLLPILDSIKRTEIMEAEAEAKRRTEVELRKQKDPYFAEPPPLDDRKHPTSGRPRAIILLPTSELVHQVAQLIRAMAYKVKVRSKGISASDPAHTIRRRIFSEDGIDILVATPHLLYAVAESDPHILSRVRHLVIDEADSLMDRSFSKVVQPIIDKSASAVQQLIFCSATIPRSLDTHLRAHYPDIRRLVTPSLHAIPRRVQLGVVDIEKIPYHGNRNLACADAIFKIDKLNHEPTPGQPEMFNVHRVLVFVNEREKTTELAEYLQTKSIDAVAFNRDSTDERQSEILRDFTARPPHMAPAAASASASASTLVAADEETPTEDPKDDTPNARVMWSPKSASSNESKQNEAPKFLTPKSFSSRAPPPAAPRLKNVKVLVSTDLLSRGVDTLAVRHVVLYDVPHTATDFIHRLGRVGRMKMRGRGIVLVGKNDRRDVVREVKEAMFRGQALI